MAEEVCSRVVRRPLAEHELARKSRRLSPLRHACGSADTCWLRPAKTTTAAAVAVAAVSTGATATAIAARTAQAKLQCHGCETRVSMWRTAPAFRSANNAAASTEGCPLPECQAGGGSSVGRAPPSVFKRRAFCLASKSSNE
jgi:hypothetical protein|eukprot:COSAG01_NODE_1586_length_9810_cov_3.655442_11_plen_142_part_00